MNDMTVGMENLPNVFIDKIILERRSINQHKIRVVVKMFDYSDDHSWRNKVDGLKVKCSFISDGRINSLNNGDISLYDISPGPLNRTMIKSCDSFRSGIRKEGHQSYVEVFEMNILEPMNLNVYVACFIDGLEFGIPMFDKFYGPMAAERIFVGGVPNEESGYFYNPETNEEYGGPVHQHSSGYMEGSMHRDEPHSGLRYVAEDNYKLIQSDLIQLELTDELFAGMDSEEEQEAGPQPSNTTTTAQQPNFNLVGNQTPIDPPPGY